MLLCEQMMRSVMIAMSGGIDSSVAAVRMIGLDPSNIPASPDICFIGGDCRNFLREQIEFAPGPLFAIIQ